MLCLAFGCSWREWADLDFCKGLLESRRPAQQYTLEGLTTICTGRGGEAKERESKGGYMYGYGHWTVDGEKEELT